MSNSENTPDSRLLTPDSGLPNPDSRLPVIAIFDVGKTNKKFVLLNEEYKLVHEEDIQIEEILDEDGFPCEDIFALTEWIRNTFNKMSDDGRLEIKAVNFSAYGASFVYLDEKKNVIPPLYNYLKPFPENLRQNFLEMYGGENLFKQTASPDLGHLNSGMQLYRLKYEKPARFAQIQYALHLPQYLSFILTGKIFSDITSIGCHTCLWNFDQNKYHEWVEQEGILEKLPPLIGSGEIAAHVHGQIPAGAGLHDSSAALIPYLMSFTEPFILISTGTWSISLNPFNNTPLKDEELKQDCLCYLSYDAKPVKASRLFAGYEHDQKVKQLAKYFKKPMDYHNGIVWDPGIPQRKETAMIGHSPLAERNSATFLNYEEAYHHLIADIVFQQVKSTNLVLQGTNVKRIFVAGGFSKNQVFMNLLASAFPGLEVYAASMSQASALGAAMVIHKYWNTKSLPEKIIDMKLYSFTRDTSV